MADDAQDARAMHDRALLEIEQGNIEQARGWFAQAIASGDPDMAPLARLNFGVLELHQGRLEEARAWFDQALASGQADAKAWALVNLGDLDRRAGRIESTRARYAAAAATGHPQAAPAALRGLEDVRQARAAVAEVIADARTSAAEFGRLGSADALRRAREAAQRALEATGPLREIPVDRMNLGMTLLDLYRTASDEAFLRAAVASVALIAPDESLLPEDARPRYLALRGDVQLTQWKAFHAGYPDAEVRAISLLDDAIGSFTAALEQIQGREDPLAAGLGPLSVDVVANLGEAALVQRHWLKVTPDLRPYLVRLDGVLRDQLGDPASRAQCGWVLGRMLWEMYAETGEPALLIDAVARFRQAVDEAPPDDGHRPAYELRDAAVSAWLAREVGDPRAAATAARQLRDLWSRRLEVSPAAVLDSAREWADLQARQQNWAASADAYVMAARAAMTLLSRRGSPDDRRVFLRRIRGLSVLAAFALAQAGRLGEAVAALERGRGIFFAEGASRGFAEGASRGAEDAGRDAPWDPDSAVPAALDAIGARTAVAFVLATWYGGAAIVLAPGRDPWLVDLPLLTEDEVERRLGRLMGAYQSERVSAHTTVIVVGGDGPEKIRPWAPELDAVAGWSWDACMGPLTGSLGGCDELTLIPVGTLPLLPLHAAWTQDVRTDDASPGPGRRYVVDLLAVSYAPSLRACLAARDRWTGFADGLALVVDDPDSTGGAPLPGAELEAAAIGELFRDVLVVRGKDATAEVIRRELPRASLAHFGCHGIADLTSPGNSGLLLSGEDRLTMAEIGRLDLSGVRLCVLSACETAMIGFELPDEVVNLPTAFAQAGAATVVGSLWAVPDEPTALLIGEFYRNLRHKGLAPAQALRQAQRWLRDSTRAEQIAALPPDRRPREETSSAAHLLQGRIRPTQNITDWAALVVSV